MYEKKTVGKIMEKKLSQLFFRGGQRPKIFREDNVRNFFGEDNVRNLFGEDNVRKWFGDDNVRKLFGEDNVRKCSGWTMSGGRKCPFSLGNLISITDQGIQ